jgi:subtilisin family serine protease
LEDEYEFVRDFKLNIPSPVRGQHRGRAALDSAEWPEECGVRHAHSEGVKGAGVLVGVCDTGVDADHDEFRHQTINFRYVSLFPNSPYWPPRDVRGFDVDGHGTHVCGIIAGQRTGVAPDASLYVASVIESETTSTSMVRTSYGLNWLLRQFSRPDNEHRPAVLSMSLGFPQVLAGDAQEHAKRLCVMEVLLQTLVQANVVPVVAIGNDGPGQYGFPGAFGNVIGVGAVDFDQQVAAFSGSGVIGTVKKPDVVGYGVSVYSSIERSYDGRSIYQRLSGTSMATPYAAGITALYRCQQPAMTVDEIRDKLHDTALGLRTHPKERVGSGLVVFKTRSAARASARIPRGRAPVKPVRPPTGGRHKSPKRK